MAGEREFKPGKGKEKFFEEINKIDIDFDEYRLYKWRLVNNKIATNYEIETYWSYREILESILMLEYQDAINYSQIDKNENWQQLD